MFLPPSFKSDGCTLAPDRWFGADLKPACRLHDFVRRYRILSVKNGDRLFYHTLLECGAPRWLARLYWIVVKIARPFFKAHTELPSEYNKHATMIRLEYYKRLG